MPRTARITATLTKAICENLELAMPLKLAGEAEGVPESTLHRWIEAGSDGQAPYAAFAAAVTKARAIAAKTLTEKALRGKKGSHAAMWFLERRFRSDYGPVQKVELSGPDGSSVDIKLDVIADAATRALLEAALGREA